MTNTDAADENAGISLAYIAALTDDELEEWMAEAHRDTIKAGTEEPQSEWHQACFCALVLMCQEKNRRMAKRMH